VVTGAVVLGLAACHDEPPLRPVSAWAAHVRVAEGDPPPGARLIGEVEASDGKGCGIEGDRGSLRNATAALQEAAARKGASFVKLTAITKPHSGHDCVHLEFKLRGLAYVLANAPAPPVVAAPSACVPPCSPGYSCNAAGVCVAECNPACGPTQICRADRVCVPAAAP